MSTEKAPSRPLDEVHPPTSKFRCIDLGYDVTHAFLMYTGSKRCYGLLHKSGSYIRVEAGPVIVNTWADAIRQANHHAADFIIVFHEERIRHRRHMPNGGVTWDRAIFWPHEIARTFPDHVPAYKGADQYGRSRSSLIEARRRANKQKEKTRAILKAGITPRSG